ncbi:hypothetical protein BGZ83_011134 [Gryganskiella cystojenkinii]|nr:hypothetical protein BGZ83_011134 [Gryganskiella cystojenkinii]
MIRITNILAFTAVILLASSSVQAQDVPGSVPAGPTTSCIIATPMAPLHQGKPYKLLLSGCSGFGEIKLRYGNPLDLEADKTPVCPRMDLSGASGSCTFVPTRSGPGFLFSTIDGSNVESFSGDFVVLESAESKMIKVQAQNWNRQSMQPQVQEKKMHNGSGKPAIMSMRKGSQSGQKQVMRRKRSLYDMTGLVYPSRA